MGTTVTVNDLYAVIKFIDLASSRGAVRGDELSAVGTLREKFVKIVEESQKQETTEETDED